MTGVLAVLVSPIQKPITATASPTNVSGYGSTGSSANITTGLVVVVPAGGIPSYSHAWTQLSSSPYTWTISAASAATTSFTCTALGPGNTAQATFQDTVTDAVGATIVVTVIAFANNGQPYDNRATIDRGSLL